MSQLEKLPIDLQNETNAFLPISLAMDIKSMEVLAAVWLPWDSSANARQAPEVLFKVQQPKL